MSQSRIYVPSCPTWCDGKHAALLAMPDAFTDADDMGPVLTDEIVFHERVIWADAATNLEVCLVATEPHPDQGTQPTPPFLQLWAAGQPLHQGPSEPLLTPEDLRRWARVLERAAEAAEQVTTW